MLELGIHDKKWHFKFDFSEKAVFIYCHYIFKKEKEKFTMFFWS